MRLATLSLASHRLTSLLIASCIRKKRKCRQCRQGRSGGFASSSCSLSSLLSRLSLAFRWPRAILGTLIRRTTPPPPSLSPLRPAGVALFRALRRYGRAELCPGCLSKISTLTTWNTIPYPSPFLQYVCSLVLVWPVLVDHRLY